MYANCNKSLLMWIFLNFLKYCYTSTPLIYSDMAPIKLQSLVNLSNVTLSSIGCNQSYNQILFEIINNSSSLTANSFEFLDFYFSCEQILGLFFDSKLNNSNRYLISHSLIDCEDIANCETLTTTVSAAHTPKLYSLSASYIQVYNALNSVVTECFSPQYGIVYANEIFYKQMAQKIINKIFQNAINNSVTSNLKFSIAINAPNLETLVFNSDINSKLLLNITFFFFACFHKNKQILFLIYFFL